MKAEGNKKGFEEVLATVPLFAGLKKKQLDVVARLGHDLSFDAGQTIVKEGELGIGFYVVLEGKAEVRRGAKVISQIGPGGFFGEMAVLDNQPRSADVVAVAPTRCAAFTAWSFEALVKVRPEIPATIMAELAKRASANARSK
ncbi:MAG TPA: cyclic nucleotide-binding domain-containing protein [Conexivisphaerales archaeon]|nr:cyclic nucleotide-binding domain-containing protein [Conexivisphaerales archaeon]